MKISKLSFFITIKGSHKKWDFITIKKYNENIKIKLFNNN